MSSVPKNLASVFADFSCGFYSLHGHRVDEGTAGCHYIKNRANYWEYHSE